MQDFEMLRALQVIQLDLGPNHLVDLGFVRIVICPYADNEFWNFAVFQDEITSSQLRELEQKFQQLEEEADKDFAICASDNQTQVLRLVKKTGYKNILHRSFFVKDLDGFQERTLDSPFDSFSEKLRFEKVQSDQGWEDFVKVFDEAFREENSASLHPGPIYLEVMEEVWRKDQSKGGKIVNHLVLYQEGEPVAVASNFNSLQHRMSYISNVGVHPRFRKKGLGGRIVNFCLADSQEFGNEQATLVTENNAGLRSFYRGLGFQNLFDFSYYAKKSN